MTFPGGQSVVRILRGTKMRSATALFDEVAAALQFPYYFGENWNAVDECLNDLEWLPGDAYVLIVLDADLVLTESDELDVFVRIVTNAGREWSAPETERTQTPQHRPAAFHLLLQCESERMAACAKRYTSAGAQLGRLA